MSEPPVCCGNLSGMVWKDQAAHWKFVHATFMPSDEALVSCEPRMEWRAPTL